MNLKYSTALKALALGSALCMLPVFAAAEGDKPVRVQRENQAKGRSQMGAPASPSKPAARSTPRVDRGDRGRGDRNRGDRRRGDRVRGERGKPGHERDYRSRERGDHRYHGTRYEDHGPRRGYHPHRRGYRHHPYHHGRHYHWPRYYHPYRSHLGLYIGPYGYFGGYLGYGYGYGYGHPYPHVTYSIGRHPQSDGMGGLDFDVSPEKAEIYIDGQYIGVADQFDGFPSYLWLEKGTYDVVIYREGYETISRQMSIYPGVVIDINDRMKPGDAVHPEELAPKSTVNRDERLRRDRERAEEAERSARSTSQRDEKIGRLRLTVLPEDSAVYLDGHFLGIAAEISRLHAGLIVEPGEHLVEVVHPSFDSQSHSIDVERGENIDLEVDLTER